MESTDLAAAPIARPRLVAATLAGAGVAFALYALLRPYADEATPEGVAAVASGAWLGSHLLAVAALILLPIGLYAADLQRAALVTAIGSGLVLPYYGAETFGLNALAVEALGSDGGMPPLTDAIRFGAAQSVTFVAGLLLLAAGGVLVAVAAHRRGGGWSGLPFGLAMVLFLPQFFGPPPVRIAHGLLVLVGCVLLARWAALNHQSSRS